jgi:hypothetical protein
MKVEGKKKEKESFFKNRAEERLTKTAKNDR